VADIFIDVLEGVEEGGRNSGGKAEICTVVNTFESLQKEISIATSIECLYPVGSSVIIIIEERFEGS
jgi:hypothetical protein